MKNPPIAGGLVVIGIGLVTIGLSDLAGRAQATPSAPAEQGVGHSPWAFASGQYSAQVTSSSPGQPDWETTVIQMLPNFASIYGQWGTGSDTTYSGICLESSGIDVIVGPTNIQVARGTVSINGGDFTFPAGSTMLGGEPETVSLQGMHAQVQGHADLHVQHVEALDALMKRIEDLEAIIESLPECTCSSDVNRDGLVDAADLGMLIGDWGPCTR